MPDTKIANLTSASTPLAGTEVLPIVQSGTTKKVSVDNLIEIGSWTPAISDGGSSVSGTSSRYAKIGKVIIAAVNISAVDISGLGVGQLRISGLPYSNNGTFTGPNSIIGSTVNNFPILASVSGSNNYALLDVGQVGGGLANFTKADFFDVTSADIKGIIIYFAS